MSKKIVQLLPVSQKGKPDGLAELNSNGLIPSTQLPSYVDDVIEGYFSNGVFYSDVELSNAITGETGKIYLDITNKKPRSYRYGGTEYIEIASASVVKLTQEEYDALSDDDKNNGTLYLIHDGDSGMVIGPVSETRDGLMTKEDKVKLDNLSSEVGSIGSKLNLSTPSSDLYGTQFTCILEGGETVTGTFDSEGHSIVYLKFVGVYTITCVDGASTTVENTALGTVYNVSITALPKATINVTTDETDFQLQTVTYSGPETGSTTFNVAGQATIVVRTAGTYTLSCGDYTTKVNIDSLTEDVTISKVFNKYIIYGFHVDSNESDPSAAVTYLEGAVGLTPAQMNYSSGAFDYGSWENAFFMPKPCMLKYDGTVDYYLNPNNYTKKADGTTSDIANTNYAGNAMMEWGQNGTKIWIKVVPDSGDATSYSIYISDAQVDSDYHAWNFYDHTNTLVDHFYTPIYNGSLISNKIRSISGQYPMKNQTAPNELTYATANNVNSDHGWTMETYGDRFLINMLLVLMGKSLDTESVFGKGNQNGYNSNDSTNYGMTVSGSMNTKGLFYGTNGTTDGVKVFGMENYWGNQRRRLVGWINNKGTQYVKMTYGTADGSTAVGYNMTGDGYINTGVTVTSNVSGYTVKYSARNAFGIVPYVGSGSETTYYCDGAWVYTSDVYVANVGGYCGNGATCGAFYVNLNVAASHSTWSFGASVSYR